MFGFSFNQLVAVILLKGIPRLNLAFLDGQFIMLIIVTVANTGMLPAT